MVGKRAPAPRNGGSARNAIWYVLGEELSAKVTHEQRNEALHSSQKVELSALLTESLARPDRGVGAVWSPSTGSRRPAQFRVLPRRHVAVYGAD